MSWPNCCLLIFPSGKSTLKEFHSWMISNSVNRVSWNRTWISEAEFKEKHAWCIGPYAGDDYIPRFMSTRVSTPTHLPSSSIEIYRVDLNPMPESTLTVCQSRLNPMPESTLSPQSGTLDLASRSVIINPLLFDPIDLLHDHLFDCGGGGRVLWRQQVSINFSNRKGMHRKKSFSIFLSPAGMSLTKPQSTLSSISCFLAYIHSIMRVKLFPSW